MLSVLMTLIFPCVLLMSMYYHYLNIVVICGYHCYAVIIIGFIENIRAFTRRAFKKCHLARMDYFNRLVFLKQHILEHSRVALCLCTFYDIYQTFVVIFQILLFVTILVMF